MHIETLILVAIAAIFVNLAICAAVLIRAARTAAADPTAVTAHLSAISDRIVGLDRLIRDEFTRGRDETAVSAKLLREEVTGSFGRLGDSLRMGMVSLAEGQKQQLDDFSSRLQETKSEAAVSAKALREEIQGTLTRLAEIIGATINQLVAHQAEKLDGIISQVTTLTEGNEVRQETLRKSVESRLDALRVENAAKLEQMRQTVDEKLQGTLEQRLGASFKLVSDQLEAVHKSVGEMQVLATGVGDLKRVLANVRSRGTWGEVSLGNLLEQMMAPEQFERNVEIKQGSNQRVEFAIRLPGDGNGPLWLPIDAKFPLEDYERLVDATERGAFEAIEAASKALEFRVRSAGKDICEKYIAPPFSTDFAIMFLPTEGLFAEIIRRPGLVDSLQRESRIMVAGPTTLVAVLTSLRMGFRTLAIQQRSSEVWRVLAAVKTEFGRFEAVMDKVSKKLHEAQNAVEEVGTRRRMMGRRLREIEMLPEADASAVLQIGGSLDEISGDDESTAAAK